MPTVGLALSTIPESHRKPLLEEYSKIVQNYLERRWSSSELCAGRFCEIVYCILDAISTGGNYTKLQKPKNMLDACRKIENQTSLSSHSLRILIPRMLPALYDVRNNRNVGHVGGDVDPNHMDATLTLSMVNWIMAELVRVLHSLPDTAEAQKLVDKLADRQLPLVWEDDGVCRVLDTAFKTKDQILLLLEAKQNTKITSKDLQSWTEYKRKGDFTKIVKGLHKGRFIEFDGKTDQVKILPSGSLHVSKIVGKYIAK